MKAFIRPRWRIWFLLGAGNAAWITVTWLWVQREHWLWVTPIALSINFLLLTYDQILKFRSLEGHPVLGNDPWGLLKTVHQLSSEMKLPMPGVYLIASPSAQIFSFKKNRKSRIYVSEGLLNLLTPRQLSAALMFQMITIRGSYDAVNYWVAAILDLCFRAGLAVERVVAFVLGWTPPIATWFLRPWTWLTQALLLGRRDFRRLDQETARQLDRPEDLAQALVKMEAYAHTKPWPQSWILAHMCMVNPLPEVRGWGRVQPVLKSRIKDLVGRYPL